MVAEEIEELLLDLIDGTGTVDDRIMFGPARAEMGNDGGMLLASRPTGVASRVGVTSSGTSTSLALKSARTGLFRNSTIVKDDSVHCEPHIRLSMCY